MLYNAYCAKLSNIGAMSSTEFLTVLRWALPRTHWAVAWSFCTGRLVLCLDLSRTGGYHTGAGVSVCSESCSTDLVIFFYFDDPVAVCTLLDVCSVVCAGLCIQWLY